MHYVADRSAALAGPMRDACAAAVARLVGWAVLLMLMLFLNFMT